MSPYCDGLSSESGIETALYGENKDNICITKWLETALAGGLKRGEFWENKIFGAKWANAYSSRMPTPYVHLSNVVGDLSRTGREMTILEISDELGISPQRVQQLIARGLAKIARMLEQRNVKGMDDLLPDD